MAFACTPSELAPHECGHGHDLPPVPSRMGNQVIPGGYLMMNTCLPLIHANLSVNSCFSALLHAFHSLHSQAKNSPIFNALLQKYANPYGTNIAMQPSSFQLYYKDGLSPSS
jgi:hypothetical protein